MEIVTTRPFEYFDGNGIKKCSDTWEVYQKLLEKVREVFDIKTREEGGLMDGELVVLVSNFMEFMHRTDEILVSDR